jgi:hypothetical protein
LMTSTFSRKFSAPSAGPGWSIHGKQALLILPHQHGIGGKSKSTVVAMLRTQSPGNQFSASSSSTGVGVGRTTLLIVVDFSGLFQEVSTVLLHLSEAFSLWLLLLAALKSSSVSQGALMRSSTQRQSVCGIEHLPILYDCVCTSWMASHCLLLVTRVSVLLCSKQHWLAPC